MDDTSFSRHDTFFAVPAYLLIVGIVGFVAGLIPYACVIVGPFAIFVIAYCLGTTSKVGSFEKFAALIISIGSFYLGLHFGLFRFFSSLKVTSPLFLVAVPVFLGILCVVGVYSGKRYVVRQQACENSQARDFP